MKELVLGVDGGTSKSHYALASLKGEILAFSPGPPLNHILFPNSYSGSMDELGRFLDIMLARHGFTKAQIVRAVLGISGCDSSEETAIFQSLASMRGLMEASIVNDAYLGVKAGTSQGFGVCSINGTGTSAAAIGSDGALRQIGGMGDYTGDAGGGEYLANQVIGAIYNAKYRFGEPSALSSGVLAALGLADVDTLVAQRLGGKIPSITVIKECFAWAQAGDAVAIRILETMGRETALSALGAAHASTFPPDFPVEFVMAGSVHVQGTSPHLRQAFTKTIEETMGSRAEVRVLRAPPVAGAIVWALEQIGLNPSIDLRQEICASLGQHAQRRI